MTNFLYKVYTSRTTATAVFFVEKQGVLPFTVRREKTFFRINLLVEIRLNS